MAKKEKKNTIVTYFEQRDIVRPIALAALIAGLLMMWLGRSYISYIIAAILILGGLAAYILTAARMVSGDEVPDQIKQAMREYDADFLASKAYREVVKHPAPHETETHIYGEGSRYYKRLKSGAVISDVYARTHLFFTQNSLIVISRRASLCELDGLTNAGITDTSSTVLLEDIISAELCESEYTVTLSDTKEAQRVKQYDMLIKMKNGGELSLPVRDDVAMTNICEEINRRCGK